MYVLISGLRVEHFNAQQTKDIVTPLPLHASVMLGHAIGAKLNAPVFRVGLILHHAAVEGEYCKTKNESRHMFSNKRGACAFMINSGVSDHGGGYSSGATGPSGMSYQANVSASGVFSIILDFDERAVAKGDIEQELSNMRLAGGNITAWSMVESFECWSDLIFRIRSGYFVLDAKEQVQLMLDSGQHIVDAMFNRREDKGFYCPVTVGYSLLTTQNSDCGGIRMPPVASGVSVVGHAFAEAVVGLVQFRHLSFFKENKKEEAEPDLEQPDLLECEDEYSDMDEYELSDDDVSDEDTDDPQIVIEPEDVLWTYGWSQDERTFLIKQK